MPARFKITKPLASKRNNDAEYKFINLFTLD